MNLYCGLRFFSRVVPLFLLIIFGRYFGVRYFLRRTCLLRVILRVINFKDREHKRVVVLISRLVIVVVGTDAYLGAAF